MKGTFFTLIGSVLSFALLLCCEGAGFAASTASNQKVPVYRIEQLRWVRQKFETREINGDSRPVVILQGQYPKEDWELNWESKLIERTRGGNFTLTVPLKGPVTTISLLAIGPLGEVERSTFQVKYPEWQKMLDQKKRDSLPQRHVFSASAGLSFLGYRESSTANLRQQALTLKVSYGYMLKPNRWDLGLNLFVNTLSFGSSSPGAQVRFFGANARVGYALPFISAPWKISLMAGFYYTTMFVTGNQFGFENLMGPQLFPVITRTLGKRSAVGTYLKYSPVSPGGIAVSSLKDREVASGVFWSRRLSSRKSFNLAIDLSQLKINIEGTQIYMNSLSFSFGLSW